MEGQTSASPQPQMDFRLKLGLVLFGLSIAVPVAGTPLVLVFDFPKPTAAVVTGSLLVLGDVLGIVAIAVMGKKGYAYIKNGALAFLKRHGPPDRVGRLRYRIGLFMFSAPLLFGWLSPYTARWIPGFASHPFLYAVGGDVLILTSLFVLGGDFWDKLRSLFFHNATARFADANSI